LKGTVLSLECTVVKVCSSREAYSAAPKYVDTAVHVYFCSGAVPRSSFYFQHECTEKRRRRAQELNT
uniref:Uncharacterized protein n=1 Tax=Stegastes partitus TaxID=144197 RepID=A0A3B5AQ27_9TELE